MNFSARRTLWLHNGYAIEFNIVDPQTICLDVITEKDPTLTSTIPTRIGFTSVSRDALSDDNDDFVGYERIGDFAVRALKEAIAFSEAKIIEHKESLDLNTILGAVLDAREQSS